MKLVSAAEAEREFGVPAALIRKWKQRRTLHVSGIDISGRPLYRAERIVELLESRRVVTVCGRR